MKWAIVFYALIAPMGSDESVEHISWQLTFGHHEQCMSFYEKNQDKLIDGLGTYIDSQYDEPMQLKEVGCAHATANFDIEEQDRDPVITLRMPLWQGFAL